MEGIVVVWFVVEFDSMIFFFEVMRDIGDGCGLEVIRVVNLINEVGVKWKLGINEGKVVWFYFILFIKFKLEEFFLYFMVGIDMVYICFDMFLDYEGGLD